MLFDFNISFIKLDCFLCVFEKVDYVYLLRILFVVFVVFFIGINKVKYW